MKHQLPKLVVKGRCQPAFGTIKNGERPEYDGVALIIFRGQAGKINARFNGSRFFLVGVEVTRLIPLRTLIKDSSRRLLRIRASIRLNHKALTYRFEGRDYRLTDVAGKLVRALLT